MLPTVTHRSCPYTGNQNSLVIGIDVGTVQSGVSYVHLECGKVPRIKPVMREENGKTKVPSAVWYDRNGSVNAAGHGSDKTSPRVNPLSAKEGVKAECFKLHLGHAQLSADEKIWPPLALPEKTEKNKDSEATEWQLLNKRKIARQVTGHRSKASVQVLTDFLRYLFESAKEYITETRRLVDPTFTWSAIEKNTHFVLTHPNGWGEDQRMQMRAAALAAGLVNGSTATRRITFVTESEASLHFCLDKNPELRQERGGLLVVDCGGGTIDISAYSQTGKGCFKQSGSQDCIPQGSVFVTARARDYFKEKLMGSKFGSDDDIEAMARAFDKNEGVKCMFCYPNRPYFIKFGCLRNNDSNHGICGGKLKVEGERVAQFFEPAVQAIINGIENKCRNTKDIKYVLLVGGFARSQYLCDKLSDHFNDRGIVILRPDGNHPNKAAADGAVSWYLDRYVSNPADLDRLNRVSGWSAANTAGNRGEVADVYQSFTAEPPPQVQARQNGQKLPGTVRAVSPKRVMFPIAGSLLAPTKVGHWQERRDPVEIDTGWKGEQAQLNPFKGSSHDENIRTMDRNPVNAHQTSGSKDDHTSMKQEHSSILSPSDGKSDMISVAEVVESVRMLQAQLGKISSLIGDSLTYRESTIPRKELEVVLNKIAASIVSNNLNAEPGPAGSSITQTALQLVLVTACKYIINNGTPPSSNDAMFYGAHGDMMEAGRASDDDTLKALARAYTTTSLRECSDINRKYLAGIALEMITAFGGSSSSGESQGI